MIEGEIYDRHPCKGCGNLIPDHREWCGGCTGPDMDELVLKDSWSPYNGKTFAQILEDYAVVRGDLTESYAREQLVGIVQAMMGSRERTVRVETLLETAEAATAGQWPPGFDFPARALVAKWLRARAHHFGGR